MHKRIGVMVPLDPGRACFTSLKAMGLETCQLVSWRPDLWKPALAARVRREAQITSGYRRNRQLPGPAVEMKVDLGLLQNSPSDLVSLERKIEREEWRRF